MRFNTIQKGHPSSNDMLKNILFVFLIGLLAWAYQATQPPPPKICGSKDGPPITAPRIQLQDGRFLAYKEFGVPKDVAKHKIVFIHCFDCCRHDLGAITSSLSPEIVENRGIYMVSFDRPGYGESDPHPDRTLNSTAFDIEELADQLGLGSKFYVLGFSMGGQIAWTCLKYIPHRLAGVGLIAPVISFWWGGIPSNLSGEAYGKQFLRDQWALRVAHYAPWLMSWWNTQKLFPSSSVIAGNPLILSGQDIQLISKRLPLLMEYKAQIRQQGKFESILRDAIIAFGKWEFDPTELRYPFSESGVPVHLWQGDEDLIVPVSLQRYIAQQLPWLRYHEISGAGHFFLIQDGMADNIVQSLVDGMKRA